MGGILSKDGFFVADDYNVVGRFNDFQTAKAVYDKFLAPYQNMQIYSIEERDLSISHLTATQYELYRRGGEVKVPVIATEVLDVQPSLAQTMWQISTNLIRQSEKNISDSGTDYSTIVTINPLL